MYFPFLIDLVYHHLMCAIIWTVPCQNLLFWALSWVIQWRTQTHWFYGKHSLVIFQMGLKWYLISSLVAERQNGSARPGLLSAFLMDMTVKGLNILVREWSASFRYHFAQVAKMWTQVSLPFKVPVLYMHIKGTYEESSYCKLALTQFYHDIHAQCWNCHNHTPHYLYKYSPFTGKMYFSPSTFLLIMAFLFAWPNEDKAKYLIGKPLFMRVHVNCATFVLCFLYFWVLTRKL